MTNDEFSNKTRCDEIMLQVSVLLEELASLQPPELAPLIQKEPKERAFTAVERKSRARAKKLLESYKIPEDIRQKLLQLNIKYN